MYKFINRGFFPIIFLNIFESEFLILRTSLQRWFSFVTFVCRPLSIPRFCDIGRACFIYMLILHTHFLCFIWRPFTILSIKISNKNLLCFSTQRCPYRECPLVRRYPTDDRIESPGVRVVRWSGIVLQTIGPNLQVLGGSHIQCKHVTMDECLVQGTVWMDDNRFWFLLYQSDDPWRTTVESATVSQALEK